jgi:hypothetical protein
MNDLDILALHYRSIILCTNFCSGFAFGSVHVSFVEDRVALGQVFLRVILFYPVSIILPWLSILIYDLGDELHAC